MEAFVDFDSLKASPGDVVVLRARQRLLAPAREAVKAQLVERFEGTGVQFVVLEHDAFDVIVLSAIAGAAQ